MHLIYASDINDTLYTVSKEESFHCIKVLRLHIDETVYLTDGKGNLYSATIIDDNPKGCSVRVFETIHDFGKRNFHLHIAIAPTKNMDRFEWFLEKATEIGIDEITPIICSHSERKIVKPERMEKVLISALKQSVKTYLPKLSEATSFKEFINKDKSGQKFIANLPEDAGTHLKTKYLKGNNSIILIGPEGDFSSEEIANAIKKDYQSISLGRYRLRTETAGIIACHTINLLNDI